MFYTFQQNNTGGEFISDPEYGVGRTVIIEADSPEEANVRADEIGIYFDYEFEYDCDCCGMRWYPVSDFDGHEVPTIYGAPVEKFPDEEIFIHRKSGEIS